VIAFWAAAAKSSTVCSMPFAVSSSGTRTEQPALRFVDPEVVDAGLPSAHQQAAAQTNLPFFVYCSVGGLQGTAGYRISRASIVSSAICSSLWRGASVEIAGDDVTGEQISAHVAERLGAPTTFSSPVGRRRSR
jgi:hypothetical protein